MCAVLWQLSRQQDELQILEQSLATTQQQLSGRVMEIVRLEQTVRRLTSELDDLTEQVASRDKEIDSLNQTIGNTPPLLTNISAFSIAYLCLQCFDAVDWVPGRTSGL